MCVGVSFGIEGIPRPCEGLWGDAYYSLFYLFFVWFFVGLAYVVIRRLSNSPFGHILKAVREDDDLPLAMGKPVFKAKLKTMALGSAFAGIAGALYAYYITYISPSDFMPLVTFLVWAMVIIGGRGNILGSLAGAAIIVAFYNSTRYLKDIWDVPAETLASLRMVAIGILIILTVLYKPDGFLKEKKKTYPGE